MAQELVPLLFERFERGGAGEGTGLGLSIAQAYARAHGGDIVYDSPSEGGARFELILPRASCISCYVGIRDGLSGRRW